MILNSQSDRSKNITNRFRNPIKRVAYWKFASHAAWDPRATRGRAYYAGFSQNMFQLHCMHCAESLEYVRVLKAQSLSIYTDYVHFCGWKDFLGKFDSPSDRLGGDYQDHAKFLLKLVSQTFFLNCIYSLPMHYLGSFFDSRTQQWPLFFKCLLSFKSFVSWRYVFSYLVQQFEISTIILGFIFK
jgi:hypothetical protein